MAKIIPVIFTFMILFSWACHKEITAYPPPRIPDASLSQTNNSVPVKLDTSIPRHTLDPDPAPSVDDIPPLGRLNEGDKNFREGNYPQAIKDYWAYLDKNRYSEVRERVLFNIGLSYALSPKSDQNLPGAISILNELMNEFPDSEYRSPVELIMSLISQVEQERQESVKQKSKAKQLQDELDKLKEIDLQRRPSRPSE